jgi:hypothetical protein
MEAGYGRSTQGSVRLASIEDIARTFEQLGPAVGEKWMVETLVSDRLHLSRGQQGEFVILLEGPLSSFGALPSWRGLAYSDDVVSIPGDKRLSVLRLGSPDVTYGNRIVAHIAYELLRRLADDAKLANEQLLGGISWILTLLGEPEALLSTEKQYGLVGECILLRRLLTLANLQGILPIEVLHRWTGHAQALRDFAATDIAIEAKTTGSTTRVHHFNSIGQLDPQSEREEVYLFSIGLRRDPSAPKKLPDFIEEVRGRLVDPSGKPNLEARSLFATQLSSYGYDPSRDSMYRALPGFLPPHLPPGLFAESRLERVRTSSFQGGCLPRMVVNVGYTLDVNCDPETPTATEDILNRLLAAKSLL